MNAQHNRNGPFGKLLKDRNYAIKKLGDEACFDLYAFLKFFNSANNFANIYSAYGEAAFDKTEIGGREFVLFAFACGYALMFMPTDANGQEVNPVDFKANLSLIKGAIFMEVRKDGKHSF